MQDFIQNGYITVEAATLPAQFHVSVADKARVLREADTPGWSSNNCFPILPELGEVLKEPHVHGALTGLLGAGYAMHPHRHCHQSAPGNSDQGIHQDSYEDDVQVRHHKPRWCMAMYYPQDVTPDLGPTAVVPGSHWYNDPHRVGDQRSSDELFGKGSGTPGHWCHETEEYHAVVPAGSVVIVHYELWHRATKLLAEDGRMRFMFKFLFVRMTDPTSPSWNCAAEALPGQQDGWARMHADAKSLAIWEWMRGRPPPPRTERSMLRPWDETKEHRDTLDGLLDMLRANSFLGIESEPQRLNAAYELGRFGGAAVGPLVEILRRESAAKSCWFQQHGLHNPGQLYSRTALAAVGKPAVPALIELLNVTREGEHEDWQVCAAAADALGDIGPMVGPDAATIQNGAAVQALVAVIEVEPHPLVVRNAVEALGYFGTRAANSSVMSHSSILCVEIADKAFAIRRSVLQAPTLCLRLGYCLDSWRPCRMTTVIPRAIDLHGCGTTLRLRSRKLFAQPSRATCQLAWNNYC